MKQNLSKINLREPAFLLWLGQFVGEWRLEGKVDVHRREDGFLEAFPIAQHRKVHLSSVLNRGTFAKRAKSLLGPYPVVLSASLMRYWLPPKDFARLRNAWTVGSGMSLILEAIEKRITDLPPSQRDKRWLEWWAKSANSVNPLSARDIGTHRALYRRYRRAA